MFKSEFFKSILIISLFGGMLTACSGSKKIAASHSDEVESTAQVSEKVQNERILIEGMRHKILGDPEGSIKELEALLKADPANDAAHYELARLYYAQKEYEKALSNIQAAVKVNPENIWYNLIYAEILTVKNDFKTASAVYDKIIALRPKEIAYYYDKAFIQEKLGQNQQAIATYDQIESITGPEEYLVMQKKRVYLLLGKVEKAAEEIEHLIQENPDEPKYYNTLAEIYAANNLKEKALATYQRILAKFPNDPFALLATADHFYQSGERAKAIDYTERAFQSKQLDVDIKVKILYQYIQYAEAKKGEMEDAFRLGKALELAHPDDAKSFAINGDLYYINKNDSAALYHYELSLKIRQNVYTVWQQVLIINSDLRQFDTMLARADDAIEFFPVQPLPYFFKGVALYHMKKYSEALIPYQRAYKLSADNKTLRSQVLSNIGDVYHDMNEHAASDSCYETVLKQDPENTYALNNYSYYLSLRKEKLDRAKELSLLSNTLEKGNSSYMDTYAWILFQRNEFKEAKEWQMKALNASDDKSAVMLEHYGDILIQLGETDEALKYWNYAKQKGSDSKTLDKKINERKYFE